MNEGREILKMRSKQQQSTTRHPAHGARLANWFIH